MDWLTANKIPVGKVAKTIFDWLKDNAGGFFDALKGSGAAVFTVGFDGAAAEPQALAAVARGHGLAATPAGSAAEALDMALRLGAGRVVICGSLYLAGEVLGASPETWPI